MGFANTQLGMLMDVLEAQYAGTSKTAPLEIGDTVVGKSLTVLNR